MSEPLLFSVSDSLTCNAVARPVVGGHFSHLALNKANIANGISDSNPYQYGPEPKRNVTDSFIQSALKTATAAKNGRIEQVAGSEADEEDDDEGASEASSSSSASNHKSSSSSSSGEIKSNSKSGSQAQSKTLSMTKSRSASRQSATPASTSVNGHQKAGKVQQPFEV